MDGKEARTLLGIKACLEGLLPLLQDKAKALCADIASAGYGSHAIICVCLAGLCTFSTRKRDKIIKKSIRAVERFAANYNTELHDQCRQKTHHHIQTSL